MFQFEFGAKGVQIESPGKFTQLGAPASQFTKMKDVWVSITRPFGFLIPRNFVFGYGDSSSGSEAR